DARRARRLVDDQIERPVVRHQPPRPGVEAPVERDVQRAGHVTGSVRLGRPRVHDEDARLEERRQTRPGEALRTAESAQDPGADLIDPLHLGEVLRRLRLTLQNGPDERILVVVAEAPVETLLVAERALRHRAERLPARRTRAVTGPDLQVVRKLGELSERTE